MYRKNPNNYHDIYFLMIEYQSSYSPKNVIHYLTVSARLSLRQFAHVLWIMSPEICLHIIIQFNCIITKLTADYILVLSPLSNDFFAWILKSKWQIDSSGFRSMSSHDFEIYWDSQAKIYGTWLVTLMIILHRYSHSNACIEIKSQSYCFCINIA